MTSFSQHIRPTMEFCTQGFNGYAVKYSPFFDSKLAVATAANYGLVGNGRLYILDLTANGIVADKWCISPFLLVWITFQRGRLMFKGTIHKTLCMILLGRRYMRIRFLQPPAMAP